MKDAGDHAVAHDAHLSEPLRRVNVADRRRGESDVAPPRSRASALVPLAGVGAGVAAAALTLSLPPAAAALALGVYAIVAGSVLAGLPSHHPHARFGLANLITLARAGGAAAFAGLAVAPELIAGAAAAWAAAAVAAALLALDGVDGWAAQRQGLASAFGARFDMETDALTILTLAALALALGKAGPWVLALGLIRYAFVAAGWLWPRLARPLPPSQRRKAVCVLQVAALAVLLAPVVVPPVSTALAALALTALVWSFAVDLYWLVRSRP